MEATACESVKETCYCENANNDEVSLSMLDEGFSVLDGLL